MVCVAGPNDNGRRLDRVCRKILPGVNLGTIYSSLRKGKIRVNGKRKSQSYRIKEGDKIEFPESFDIQRVTGLKAEQLPEHSRKVLRQAIVYEDSDLLAVNKPPGVLTHGRDSLQKFLKSYLRDSQAESLAFTPAPLHRLDRNTSGIVVCGKTIEGSRLFSKLLRENKILKMYLSINDGIIGGNELWNDTITRDDKKKVSYSDPGGDPATMHALPLIGYGGKTFCLMVPLTGKTHQIRIQSALHGAPLTGDRKYNGKKQKKGPYYLHAYSTEIPRCFSGDGEERDKVSVTAPLPHHFRNALYTLFPEALIGPLLGRLDEEIAAAIGKIHKQP